MWRRVYLFLLLVRFYFALSPSYLHPDENFQGPEVIAGELFPYPSHRTWEWTTSNPIRSVFPLWPVYGLPMTLLKWMWAEDDTGLVSPEAIYYALRMVMFILSFVIEDWAIHEMVQSPLRRSQAVALVASSYVTWTFQSHTFSNSIETLLVAWSLVLIERIACEKRRSSALSCITLGFLVVFGIFNRITFPAFVVIPGLQLLPHFLHRPFSFLFLTFSCIFFSAMAIATDTAFYSGSLSTQSFQALFAHLYNMPIITPLNNFRYNTQSSNLASHGLHSHRQHFLVNLPQLLGPALVLLVISFWPLDLDKLKMIFENPRITSALGGTFLLSVIPHQEPRFLLPCVPLLLTCIRLPRSTKWKRSFWMAWICFNSIMGILMGIYHQGGIIPAQLAIPTVIKEANASSTTIFWWKTYPPPTYFLSSNRSTSTDSIQAKITTIPLMGLSTSDLLSKLSDTYPPKATSMICNSINNVSLVPKAIYLVAPLSAHLFDNTSSQPPLSPRTFSFSLRTSSSAPTTSAMTHLALIQKWHYKRHLNLDDIDIGNDGVLGTIRRVIGRRGLGVFHVLPICSDLESSGFRPKAEGS